jgi:hypothetical protein
MDRENEKGRLLPTERLMKVRFKVQAKLNASKTAFQRLKYQQLVNVSSTNVPAPPVISSLRESILRPVTDSPLTVRH